MSRLLLLLVLSLALTAPAAAQAPGGSSVMSKPVSAKRVRTLVQAISGCRIMHPSRCKALGELAALGSAGAPGLLPLLDDPDPKLRAAAVSAAGQMRLSEAGAKLLASLKDDDDNVRSAALTALGHVQPEGTVKALAGSLGAKNVIHRIAAAMALCRS